LDEFEKENAKTKEDLLETQNEKLDKVDDTVSKKTAELADKASEDYEKVYSDIEKSTLDHNEKMNEIVGDGLAKVNEKYSDLLKSSQDLSRNQAIVSEKLGIGDVTSKLESQLGLPDSDLFNEQVQLQEQALDTAQKTFQQEADTQARQRTYSEESLKQQEALVSEQKRANDLREKSQGTAEFVLNVPPTLEPQIKSFLYTLMRDVVLESSASGVDLLLGIPSGGQ